MNVKKRLNFWSQRRLSVHSFWSIYFSINCQLPWLRSLVKHNVAAKHGSSKPLTSYELWLLELRIKSTCILASIPDALLDMCKSSIFGFWTQQAISFSMHCLFHMNLYLRTHHVSMLSLHKFTAMDKLHGYSTETIWWCNNLPFIHDSQNGDNCCSITHWSKRNHIPLQLAALNMYNKIRIILCNMYYHWLEASSSCFQNDKLFIKFLTKKSCLHWNVFKTCQTFSWIYTSQKNIKMIYTCQVGC